MPARAFLLLMTLFALALGASACGGEDDAAQVLTETFGEEHQVKSGRLEVSVGFEAEGLPSVTGPLRLRLSGPFQSEGSDKVPRFDLSLALDGAGQQLSAGAVSTGDAAFLRFLDGVYSVPAEQFRPIAERYVAQAKCNAGRDDGISLSSLGVDPRRWLRDPKVEGTEEVGGVEATHVTAQLDVPRFVDDLNRVLGRTDLQRPDPCAEEEAQAQPAPQQLSEAERAQIAEAIKGAKVELWSGEEDRALRRLNVLLDIAVPEERQAQARGLSSGRLSFDLLFGALNEPQRIDTPTGARPLSELTERFGGSLPLPGAGAPPEGTGTTPSAPAPEAGGSGADEYQTCVQEAEGDIAALQRCAELLTP